MGLRILLFVTSFLLLSLQAFSQTEDTAFSKSSLLVLPIAYYTPETNLALGIGGIAYYNFGKNRDETRPSSAYFYASYTLNNQIVIDLPFHVFTNEEKWYGTGEIAIYDFPFKFYGVGCEIDPSHYEAYFLKQLKVNTSLYRKVKGHWYAGPRIWVDYLNEIDYKENGRISMLSFKGRNGGTSTGLGFGFLYDTRRNVYCPKQGWFIELGYLNYNIDRFNLSKFQNLKVEIRHYARLSKSTVLATNFFGNFNIGNVPFYMLAEFGGLFKMRGYYRGSYRDENVMLLQAEIRQDLIGRFGFTVFGGLGSVFSNEDRVLTKVPKPSGGFGLRFKINRKEDIPLRADFGFGQGFHGNYITTGEAY